jgi:short-subunit dehydrogenase
VKYFEEGGSIINMGSVASRITSPNSAVYSGTNPYKSHTGFQNNRK